MDILGTVTDIHLVKHLDAVGILLMNPGLKF